MLTLAAPAWLLLLPLPLLVLAFAPPRAERRPALAVPFLDLLAQLSGRSPAHGASVARPTRLQRLLTWALWALLVLSLAQPQRIEDPLVKTVPTRDLLLAVDLSGSMQTEDFSTAGGEVSDRLTAVKEVLAEFLAKRQGDRVGLLVFGNAPFVQAPFTEDSQVCRALLEETAVGMAGPQTMLGDAVGLAIRVFDQSEVQSKTLILLTDGNDSGSKVPPLEAAEVARDEGITIHTVAVGDPETAGEEALDEETLRGMSRRTGGTYARAEDRAGLEAVYARLDRLETRELETISHRPVRELAHAPLIAALALALLFHLSQLALLAPLAGAVACAAGLSCGWLAQALAPAQGPPLLRPWALGGVALAALVARQAARRRSQAGAWEGVIEPRFLRHLLLGAGDRAGSAPALLLGVALGLASVAAAGPTWRLAPSPFTEDRAALVVVLRAAPSMALEDVAPSRQERAAHKVRDMLALRPGGHHALVAYSGSAHRVTPLTRDASLIERFAGALSAGVMPVEGDALAEALALADAELSRARRAGAVLLITDELGPEGRAALAARPREAPPVLVLGVGGPEALARADLDGLGRSFAALTPDDADVRSLAPLVSASLAQAPLGEGQAWRDEGPWLVPLIAGLTLIWFRPGWTVTWR